MTSDKKKKRASARRSPRVTRRSSLNTARKVLRTEADAIATLIGRLDTSFERAVELLATTTGRVVVTGMGKSGLVARKIAATFSSTGTPAFFLHPAEATHGDMGMLVVGDTVVALSYSGETDEILRLLARIKRLAVPVISMTGDRNSTLAQASDVLLDVSIEREACSLNLAPTASTTASLALGDALAIALLERKGFREDDFAELHPGGELGKKIQRVEHLMHTGDAVPAVRPDTPMPRVIEEMSRKGFGMANVVADGRRLAGIITDGDLRRWLQKAGKDWSRQTARDAMSQKSTTIQAKESAARAVRLMEAQRITSLPVVDGRGRLVGLLHLHDCSDLRRKIPEDRSVNGNLPECGK
ncbi:MAG: KpsF/GutQ family sugar-phosphate isomerase [Acidobacteria bacterium]|nr:KpsF/GutQ family sugar-phosphate isomerase [Acidobacteriota bacterium]